MSFDIDIQGLGRQLSQSELLFRILGCWIWYGTASKQPVGCEIMNYRWRKPSYNYCSNLYKLYQVLLQFVTLHDQWLTSTLLCLYLLQYLLSSIILTMKSKLSLINNTLELILSLFKDSMTRIEEKFSIPENIYFICIQFCVTSK